MALIPLLSKSSRQNLDLLYQALKKSEITNKFTQAGILAVCAKESGFTLRAEFDYSTTGTDRIRQIFGLSDFTDSQIDKLKKNPEEWFDYLYGGKYENSTAQRRFETIGKTLPRSEGYKYRGRGFNQVTFKTLYKQLLPFADGKDIVKNPDLMLEPKVAASVLVGFFLKNFKDFPNILKAWNMKDKNDAKNLTEGVGVPFHLTGGVGYTRAQVVALGTRIGSWQKSTEYVKEFYNWILKKEGENPDPGAYDESEPTPGESDTGSAEDGGTGGRGEDTGSGRSGNRRRSSDSSDTSGPEVRNIIQPKLKAKQISFELAVDEDVKKDVLSNFGKIPMLWYNSYQIRVEDIKYLCLFNDGSVPCIKATFKDSLNLMRDVAFPLDDTRVSVFINTLSEQLKPIHLDFKITKFSSVNQEYSLTGTLDVSELYVKKFKSIKDSTSFNALQTLAEEIGFGYNSNTDDTDDEMTWINFGGRIHQFIDHIAERSYKSDEAFLTTFIDYNYCINFIEVEKELKRDIKKELGLQSIGIDEAAKVEKKEKLSKLLLSNDMSFRSTNSFIESWRVINNSTQVSIKEGYFTKIKYYDNVKKEFNIFDVDGLTTSEDKIIMKGSPQDEKFFSDNVNLVYSGKLDTTNMHKNYQYSHIQNRRNFTELQKVGIEVIMANANYNLKRFQKILVVLSNQASTPSASQINNRLTGEWLIIDIVYRLENKSYRQVVKLVKRELELSEEELAKEGRQDKKANPDEKTFENNPQESESDQDQSSDQSVSNQSNKTLVKGENKLFFVGGLDEGSYKNLDVQTELVRKGWPDADITSWRHKTITNSGKDMKGPSLYDLIKKNPNTPILLFSQGCQYCDVLAKFMKENNLNLANLYINEPYTESSAQLTATNNAVSKGVPIQNVFVGTTPDVGSNIPGKTTKLGVKSTGMSAHWDSLTAAAGYLKKKYTNISTTVPASQTISNQPITNQANNQPNNQANNQSNNQPNTNQTNNSNQSDWVVGEVIASGTAQPSKWTGLGSPPIVKWSVRKGKIVGYYIGDTEEPGGGGSTLNGYIKSRVILETQEMAQEDADYLS